jgi:hypothetical protein
MNNKKLSISKQIVSITEIAQMVQLSRARFYQLLEQGFFPKPLYDERSKRPYYDLALQKKILECRQSGIGVDGSYMLFYSPRKKETTPRKIEQKIDPYIKELVETLTTMGLDITAKQVQQGLIEIYPDGTDGQEQGVVIRELFRYLKNSV